MDNKGFIVLLNFTFRLSFCTFIFDYELVHKWMIKGFILV